MTDQIEWDYRPTKEDLEHLSMMTRCFSQVMFDRLRDVHILLAEHIDGQPDALATTDYDYIKDRAVITVAMRRAVENDLMLTDILWHELVHVDQYRVGRLTYCIALNGDVCWVWDNELYEPIKDPRFTLDLPWEVEAYKAQSKFISAFLEPERSAEWHYAKFENSFKYM